MKIKAKGSKFCSYTEHFSPDLYFNAVVPDGGSAA